MRLIDRLRPMMPLLLLVFGAALPSPAAAQLTAGAVIVDGANVDKTQLRALLGGLPPVITANDGRVVGGFNMADANTGTGGGAAGSQSFSAPRLFLGRNTPSGDDAAILIGRGIVGSGSFDHAVRDESTFVSSGTGAYASFDSAPAMTGSIHYNHFRSFQSRPTYSGSGAVDEINGYQFGPTLTAGSAGEVYGLHIVNAGLSGGATITGQQTGVYIAALSGAANGNYGIYDFNDNILLGNLQIAGYVVGATTIVATDQVTAKDFVATGGATSYPAGGSVGVLGTVGAAGYGGVQAYADAGVTAKGLALEPAGGSVIVGAAVPVTGKTVEVVGTISVSGLPTYSDNTAATTAGLPVGSFYRTSTGVVMVRY